MVIKRCPHCHRNFSADKHDIDFQHTCDSDSSTLNNEDKFNINTHPMIGFANKLQGTTPNILTGARLQSKTSRGNNENTHTTRQREIMINLKDNTWSENPTR